MGQSTRLTGDRWYGKTSLLRLVEDACQRRGEAVVRISAQRSTLADFVAALRAELASLGSPLLDEVDKWKLGVDLGLASAERAVVERTLDQLIQRTLAWLGGTRLVLLVDEVPVLARRLEASEPGAGVDFLHLLRRVRQDHDGQLAMVLSGSIGFHHVATDGVINDLDKVEVDALAPGDAAKLAASLLLGETIAPPDLANTSHAIALATEGIPFYIHHLVKSCRRRVSTGRSISAAVIPELVTEAITDPDDPWDLKHYRRRLEGYYGPPQVPLATAVIDAYADSGGALGVDQTMAALGAVEFDVRPGRQEVADLIGLLEADHYLAREGAASRFRSDLVRRAWLAQRR